MLKKLSSIILYPFILCFIPPTTIYFKNYNLFSLNDIFLSSIISLLIIISFFYILKKVLNDSVLAGLFILFIWTQLIFSLSFFTLVIFFLMLIHINFNLKAEVTFFLNIIGLALATYAVFNIAMIQFDLLNVKPSKDNIFSSIQIRQKNKVQPSVIHIMLDAYAGFQPLKEYMGYDNHAFKNELKALKFTVLDTQTPYNRTVYSMAAMFNGNYINKGALINDGNTQLFERMLADTVTNGNVVNTFKNLGYHLYFSPSGYIYNYPIGKLLISKAIKHNLLNYVLTTHFSPLLNKYLFSPFVYFNQFVDNVFSFDFKKFKLNEPVYMYLHILSPHPPFNVDENGNLTEKYEANNGFMFDADKRHQGTMEGQIKYRNGYIAKLKYTNKAIIKLIKNIQSNVKGPKIILVHGDHGSKMMFFEKSIDSSCIEESFSSFLAVYSDVEDIKSMLSKQKPLNLVNTYRGIFNILFNQNLPFLKGKSFFVPQLTAPNVKLYDRLKPFTFSKQCLSWDKRILQYSHLCTSKTIDT